MHTKEEIPEIIYFDSGEVERISFYINGFLHNQKKFNYKFLIKREKPGFMKQSSQNEEWHKSELGFFEFKNGHNSFFFCIDRNDPSTTYRNEGYLISVLEEVKYYFKVNYNVDEIEKEPRLKEYREKIVPLGPSFPLHIKNMNRFMSRIIPGKKNNWTFQIFVERMNLMFRFPGLSYFRRLRKIKPDLNLFFVVPFYHNQIELNDYRYELMKSLESLIKTNIIIGFASRRKLPDKYQYFKQPVYEMRSYLRHLARSKVTIYIRGPHNGISSKFGQLMAMGKPIIGQTIHNNRELYYQNQFFDEQFAYDEPGEIARQVHRLLQDPEKAASFAKANAHTFDTRFSPEVTVSHIIETIFN